MLDRRAAAGIESGTFFQIFLENPVAEQHLGYILTKAKIPKKYFKKNKNSGNFEENKYIKKIKFKNLSIILYKIYLKKKEKPNI